MLSQFSLDVDAGLSARYKSIPSKYFYDEVGSQIFQQIMDLPEYYLTNCEFNLFKQHKQRFLELFQEGNKEFDLVELGAGDGLKTKVLLAHFLEQKADFRYLPIDISADALAGLVADLTQSMPALKVEGIENDYFNALADLAADQERREVILFLGSNVGNFNEVAAIKFFRNLHARMSANDLLMIGFDLKKDPKVILKAYNDAAGVTRSFNMNLLTRINRELGGDFDLEKWDHYPTYDPFSGEVRSYLVSTVEQEVRVESLGKTFSFNKGEPIHTEISRKYDLSEIEDLAAEAGFRIVEHVMDAHCYFVDTVWAKI